jgi:hypothetical protein
MTKNQVIVSTPPSFTCDTARSPPLPVKREEKKTLTQKQALKNSHSLRVNFLFGTQFCNPNSVWRREISNSGLFTVTLNNPWCRTVIVNKSGAPPPGGSPPELRVGLGGEVYHYAKWAFLVKREYWQLEHIPTNFKSQKFISQRSTGSS